MDRSRIKFILTLFIVIFLLNGCTPTLEREILKYNSVIEQLDKFKATYPALALFIGQVEKNFKEKWVMINTSSLSEAKIVRMNEAINGVGRDDLVKSLMSYENHAETIKGLRKELEHTGDLQFKAMINNAQYTSGKAFTDAAAVIAKARPADYGKSVDAVKKADVILIDALARLKKSMAFIKNGRS